MSTGRLGAGDSAIQSTIFDAKADLLTATAADTPARLAVGSNGQYLKADSTTATGLAWATLPSSGKVLQVVHGYTNSSTTIATTTPTDTNITATITPSATTSKIAIFACVNVSMQAAQSGFNGGDLRLMRGATSITSWNGGDGRFLGGAFTSSNMTFAQVWVTGSVVWLDSPSTTSATTYKLQGFVNSTAASQSMTFQFSGATSSIILMEIGA